MKKLLAVILCLTMLFAFASPASAAGAVSESITSYPELLEWLDCDSNGVYHFKDYPLYYGGNNPMSDEDISFVYNEFKAFQNGDTDRIRLAFFLRSKSGSGKYSFDFYLISFPPDNYSFEKTTFSSGGFRYDIKSPSCVYMSVHLGVVNSSDDRLVYHFFITNPSTGSHSIHPASSSVVQLFSSFPENIAPSDYDWRELSENIDLLSFSDFPKTSHTLTINYQYADGSEAAPPVTQQLEAGAAYSVPSPMIEGYTADRLTVSGTMPDSDHTETVVYTPVKPSTYTLTINYQHENGTQAAPSHVQELAPGAEYSVDSPVLENYLANYLTVSGTMPEEDVTHTVTYTPTAYPLTIHYRYAGGLQASPSITRHLAAGAEYAVDSPVITGYTADQLTVSGTMPAQSLTVTVTYTRSGSGGGGTDPPSGPGPWWQDFDDPFSSPPLWQDFDDPFDSPPLWQDTGPLDYPIWWQDFDDPFSSPPLWQDFDDPFAAIFGRSFQHAEGDGS